MSLERSYVLVLVSLEPVLASAGVLGSRDLSHYSHERTTAQSYKHATTNVAQAGISSRRPRSSKRTGGEAAGSCRRLSQAWSCVRRIDLPGMRLCVGEEGSIACAAGQVTGCKFTRRTKCTGSRHGNPRPSTCHCRCHIVLPVSLSQLSPSLGFSPSTPSFFDGNVRSQHETHPTALTPQRSRPARSPPRNRLCPTQDATLEVEKTPMCCSAQVSTKVREHQGR